MSFASNRCFFCCEMDNLIPMNTNSLIIGSVYIDFTPLILELFQIKIDDESNSMVCNACKDHLSQFYVMKQQASKHLSPSEIRKHQIIDSVTNFIDSTPFDCIVQRYSKLIAIHPDSNDEMLPEQLSNCNNLLEIEEVITDFNVKEETTVEYSNYEMTQIEPNDSDNIKKCIDEIEVEDYIESKTVSENEMNYSVVKQDTVPAPRKKKYQKSSLDPKQREWMKKEIKQNILIIETSSGSKTQWRCRKCPLKLFSSENAFRIHLKVHLEQSDVTQEDELHDHEQKMLTEEDQSMIEQKLWIQQQLQIQKREHKTKDGQKIEWTCSQCDFETQKRGRFRMHLQRNHTTIQSRGPNKHSCHVCHLRFDGESHLLVHRNCHRIFDVIAPYAFYPQCCNMIFVSNEDHQIHVNRHNENPEALHDVIPAIGVVHRHGENFISDDDDPPECLDENAPTCGHCLQKFENEIECKQHLMLHHATSFTCPFDSRVFDGIPTLSFGNHLRQCHPDIFPDLQIACSFCKMQFETVYAKLAHMKTCKAKMFQCDHCERSFFRKTELLHHLKVITGLMVFACHFCGKRCKDQGDLKTHIRSHTNDRPYQCPHCEKAYKTSSARASHVESHMEQNHVCNVCNVKFRRRILYQRHMRLLHDEAYRQKCFAENTCKLCDKSYLRKTHFKNHMKTHNNLG